MSNLIAFFNIFLEPFCFTFVLMAIAYVNKSYNTLKLAYICFVAISIDYWICSLPISSNWSHFYWNWEGKFGEIIWTLILIYFFKWANSTDIGFTIPRMNDMLLGISIGLIYTIVTLMEVLLTQQFPPKNILNLETVLYQFTMPGLAEELFHRGFLLAILNRYFGYRWQFFKVKWGIGAILVTLLFIFGHVVYSGKGENNIGIHLENLSWDLIFISICLVFLREKTGSIWPGVLCHNVANGLQFLVYWILL